jgi:hypothetical protein
VTETVHNSLSYLDATESRLRRLSQTLADAPLVFELEGAEAARAIATELGDQINDYLIPRIRRIDAPLLAVLGGSTGSGKSTITNTLAGAVVSKSGVIRPTTRAPTLICHPEDTRWFMATGENGILAGLPRVTGEGDPSGHVLKVTEVGTMTPGLAIVDAPDIDSVAHENRELATQLLASADLWLFTTTAVRYADAVPWDFLRRARDRGTSLAIIINRIPVGAASEVVPHLAEMMAKEGFADITVFPIEETELTPLGLLPQGSISEIADQLDALAASAEERSIVIRRTLDGALRSVPNRARIVHDAVVNQDRAVAELKSAVDHQYGSARDALFDALTGGTLLRNEVLDRWQELIGVSELLSRLQSFLGRLRDRVTSAVTGRVPDTATVQGEITHTLEQLLVDLADDAALHAVASWRQLPGGRQTLGTDTGLERSSVELRSRAADEIRAWQNDVLELVRTTAQGKRNLARGLAFAVNSVGVALMIFIFSQSFGVSGAEVAVASGTAAVSQTLLNAIFGEQAVRDLANTARQSLLDRAGALLDTDANRFLEALWSIAGPPEQGAELAVAITSLEETL